MSGIQNIINHIQEDTAKEQAAILRQAESHAQKLLEETNARCDAAEAKSGEEARRAAEQLLQTADSAAHKDGKSMLLAARRSLLEQAFADALHTLNSLSGADLYAALRRIVIANAQPGEGRLILSEKDAAGLPDSFLEECNAGIQNGTVTLSPEHRELGGGVVLQYGMIEINCAFAEMLSASAEKLEDEVSRLLFA